jgi:penicillin amidase
MARGKLSEMMGEFMLQTDKLNLAIGMEYWAKETAEKVKEMHLQGEIDFYPSLESYIEGINYYINTHRHERPIEYSLFNAEPTEFSFVDLFSILKYMSLYYMWQYDDLYRAVNLEAFRSVDERWYHELFNPVSPYTIPVCPNYGEYKANPKVASTSYELNPSLRAGISNFIKNVESIPFQKYLIDTQFTRGSNNWVVDGVKSNTGKPILCNDQHWGWVLPQFLYEAHLVSADTGLNLYGYTIPGLSVPIAGFNQFLGWGMTIAPFDVMDWYYYNTVSDTHYIYNGVSTSFTTRTYNINIKDQDPVEFIVKETVHGPVLSDFISAGSVPEAFSGQNIVLAPKWLPNSITYEFIGIFEVIHSTNVNEFNFGLSFFDTPSMNFVYGDINGNIAIKPNGLVPIREGNGVFPYNGSKGEGEWTSFVPFEDLPYSLNPEQHYLASANQIGHGPDYDYYLYNGYATGYRARRINDLLQNAPGGSISASKMAEYQNDFYSSAAEAFMPSLINIIEDYYDFSPPAKTSNALEIIKDWNYVMDKELAAPTVYRKWRDYFMDYTFDDEFEKYGAIQSPQLNILEYLMKEDANSHWFDNVSTTSIVETREDIMTKAFNDAIEWLEVFYGSFDPSTWRWGDIHKYYLAHLTGLPSFSKGPYDGSGEGFTLTPSGANIQNGVGYSRGGAAHRLIVDFSNLNNSLSVTSGGASGLTSSKHYSDQFEKLFYEGKHHYTYFSNTPNNFPTTSIESTIYLQATGG